MTVYIKKSTDVGAPSLTQAAGSLITLLDFLLVTTMGWTKPYTGTNKAAYRMPAGTNQFYLRVDDSTANTARVEMFESMSGVDTGSGDFPTTAQISGGLYIDKASASATRAWNFYSNGKYCYLFIQQDGTNWWLTRWGDFESYKTGDAYNTDIAGQTAANNATINAALAYRSVGETPAGNFVARPYTQVGSSLAVRGNTDWTRCNAGSSTGVLMGSVGLTYPSPIEGGLHLAPVWVGEASANYRGLIPGLWAPCHVKPLVHGDTFAGVGNLSGRTFEAVNVGSTGQVFIETSDTWGGV